MSVAELVTVTTAGHVATVEINRPDALNALNDTVLEQLSAALSRIPNESRVLLVRGAGGKAFVAGADIKVMREGGAEAFIALGQRVMCEVEALPQTVIAVIDGFALGGGLELALSCDLIVVTERAKLGQPEVKLGIIPGFGGTQRLMRRCGLGAAKRLIFTGETISGEEAYRLGIAEYLFQSAELSAKLEALTREISERGPLAIAAAKRAMQFSFGAGAELALRNEVEEFLGTLGTADGKEGLDAFVAKRKAEFRGA